MNKKYLFVITLFFITRITSHAQEIKAKLNGDSLRVEVFDTLFKVKHSPTRAAILSAVFPGAGQIYNRKYWKLPIVYGGLGTCIYLAINFTNKYNFYQNAYVQFNKNNTEPIKDIEYLKGKSNEYINRYLTVYKDAYRRYRDMNILIGCAVYALNIIDATVDAYLFNYDISDNLSVHIEPTMINNLAFTGTPGLKLSFTFR